MNELKDKLLQVCNDSGLPLEAVCYVVKDIWRDAEDTLRQLTLQKEAFEEGKE